MPESISSHSLTQQSSTRKTLVIITGLALLAVIVNGMIGLFAMRYGNAEYQKDLNQLGYYGQANDLTNSAAISFKRQVQEWKNMLLRGDEEADRQKYQTSFQQQQADVIDKLNQLKTLPDDLDVDKAAIAAMLDDYQQINIAYQQAYQQYDPTDPASAFRIDDFVRGIDRQFDQQLDALANRQMELAQEFIETTVKATRGRAERLERIMTISTIVCCLLVVTVLFVAGRAIRKN